MNDSSVIGLEESQQNSYHGGKVNSWNTVARSSFLWEKWEEGNGQASCTSIRILVENMSELEGYSGVITTIWKWKGSHLTKLSAHITLSYDMKLGKGCGW